ncbi:MAG: hypothetical protein M3494_11910 [Actinomycetota bacterium]|jgi:hypothetical protein|nr:hypothetical protein [Rubrobacter sp.]MDQ3508701.1 hypothetical protein [Actinomycetota bacterium]
MPLFKHFSSFEAARNPRTFFRREAGIVRGPAPDGRGGRSPGFPPGEALAPRQMEIVEEVTAPLLEEFYGGA